MRALMGMAIESVARLKNRGRPYGSLNLKVTVVPLNASLDCRIAAMVRL
jgi:hypothetical protein